MFGLVCVTTNNSTPPAPALGNPPFTLRSSILDSRAALSKRTLCITAIMAREDLRFHLRVAYRTTILEHFSIPGSEVEIALLNDEDPPYRFAAWGRPAERGSGAQSGL
ncbi:MAG: hypothetical protein Q9208_003851 [Pyrenodesmia sp. 3 TL-2023]